MGLNRLFCRRLSPKKKMKYNIEIDVPSGLDLSHAEQSISDALYFADNVTQAEFNLVWSVISRLQVEQTKNEELSSRQMNVGYKTTSVSQIATQIKNLDAKIKSALNDGVTDLFLDWDSNEIRFNDGYVVCSVAPSIITRVERYAFLTWQEASDILKELYWKASSLGYLSIKERRGDLIIQICENIQDLSWARRVALGNYQKSLYDCKEGKEVSI
jgi:hypothetical protein